MADTKSEQNPIADEREPRPAAKVSLPPFGLAQEILRQMAKPDRPAPTAAQPTPVAAATTPSAPAGYRGRDSLLQFADAVMSVAGEKTAAAVEPEHHLVTFFLDKEEYGVPVLRSREIVRVGDITRIPEAPPHIRGVFNLRGRILPIVDLRTRLGLAPAVLTPKSRIILVDAHGRQLSLLVDAVARMARVRASAVKPPPADVLSAYTDYVTGVAQLGDRLIIMLDLDKVLLLSPAAVEPASAAPLRAGV
jgi:purine-binding chemotaxis protein CheW